MSKNLGNITEDDTIYFKFTTHAADGTPTTLSGSPVLSCYQDNGTTQTTNGFTLVADFDSITGLNHVTLDLTNAFYTADADYSVIITTGTVDGVSVVGYEVATFSIEKRFDEVDMVKIGGAPQSATDLKDFADAGYNPSTNKVVGVSLVDTTTTNSDMRGTDSAATAAALSTHDGKLDTVDGIVDQILVDTGTDIPARFDGVEGATFNTATDSLEAIRDRGDAAWTTGSGTGLSSLATGTAQSGGSNGITLAAGANSNDDYYNGTRILTTGGTGIGQSRIIVDYTGSTKVAEVKPNWVTNPDATTTYEIQASQADLGTVDRDSQSVIDLKDFADAGYDPGTNKVQGVVLVDTCTTNTDMVGTDNAALASVCTETRLAELDAGNIPTDLSNIETDTQDIQGRLPAALVSGRMDSDVGAMQNDVITAAKVAADVHQENIQLMKTYDVSGTAGVDGSLYHDLSGVWTDVYVKPSTGNDSNLGTPDEPLLTISEANDRLPDGGTIWIMENYGSFNEDAGAVVALNSGVQLRGYRGRKDITGSRGNEFFFVLDGYVKDLYIENQAAGDTMYLTNSVVENSEINVLSSGTQTEKTIFKNSYVGNSAGQVLGDSCKFYNTTWASGPTIYGTKHEFYNCTFSLGMGFDATADTVSFEGCLFNVITISNAASDIWFKNCSADQVNVSDAAATGGYIGNIITSWSNNASGFNIIKSGSVSSFLNTDIVESTAGRISGNFDEFYDNSDAQTTKNVDDVGGSASSSPEVLQTTTITGLSSQTVFNLTAGSADDDAYNGAMVVIEDQSTAIQKAVGFVKNYTGATKTITLQKDPGAFTIANGDTIDVIAVNTYGVWDELKSSHVVVDSFGYKYPNNYIMGSSTQQNKDDNIDDTQTAVNAIKAKTDNLPEGIQKNTALDDFEFFMVDSTDHISAKTGLTVAGTVSIDGAAFTGLTNSVTEVASGIYKIDLHADDLNGNVITLRFTASGADDRLITIKTNA